ncbi:MAG TPA: hypothetical protein VHM48_14770 [Candidatus Limnocylindrales bacterium]|nr:hypothetical protein [Candidatus Limnocylindrales bacterium]
MNPLQFLADLETRPQWLGLLADRFARGNPFTAVPRDVERGRGPRRGAARRDLVAPNRAHACMGRQQAGDESITLLTQRAAEQ